MAERSKSKTVTTRLIDQKKSPEPYRVLNQLVASHRDDLADCKIALFWRTGWLPDPDGNLHHTKTILRGDRERQLANFDLGIEINQDVWNAAPDDGSFRHAMILHALCRVQQKVDGDGEPKENDLGLPVYRSRREDIREFQDVVAMYGSYHERLDAFVAAAKQTQPRIPTGRAAKPKPAATKAKGSGKRGMINTSG